MDGGGWSGGLRELQQDGSFKGMEGGGVRVTGGVGTPQCFEQKVWRVGVGGVQLGLKFKISVLEAVAAGVLLQHVKKDHIPS